jgi:replication factor C subunit 1
MKDIRMNPFEACKKVFEASAQKKSIYDKMDYFFTDYSLMPLLVHENYLNVKVNDLQGKNRKQQECHHLQLLSESIDSICQADQIGRVLRTNNNWSLLPTQAVFATVIPGEKLKGGIGLPAFPGWFGKNSKQSRVDRVLQELQKHMRMHISANKVGVSMDYLTILKEKLSKPLIKKANDGVAEVIHTMNEYYLTRDDFDTILELSTWPGQKDLMTCIDSKVKANFTRTFNKESHKNPFSIVDVKKLKAMSSTAEEGDMNEDDNENNSEDETNDDDPTKDAMIKVKPKKKEPVKKAATTTGVKRTATETKTQASKKKKV